MTRYLLFISYIGTQFRAVQKQIVNAEPNKLDPNSVQGIIEICSKKFNPENEPYVYVSSRTDQGVHALRSSAHIDLVRRNGRIYEPQSLLAGFNKYFTSKDIDLRIQSIKIVPDSFHARFNAKSRKYLYRLAVRKPDAPSEVEIPFAEWKRCHFVDVPQFDVSLMESAARLFPGSRDFRTFTNNNRCKEDMNTVKDMYKLDVVPGRPLLNSEYSPNCSHYDYWDIICHGRSFLYRQVRRIVGTLIAVASGSISIEEVKYMLNTPSKDSWNNCIGVVPPFGLYLLDVEYDPQDMEMQNSEIATKPPVADI
ncbi:hypothetical protein L9F63_007397 [Diploptera punctata]|uniref:tRNA pseudouridine synthase n=1 Tax=Diploptera punctata TaxID=6984 RepID=A0AAD7Z8A1_DIPPU|nr:hypothetical protein L9F63_007397 [Diploptera punctata]